MKGRCVSCKRLGRTSILGLNLTGDRDGIQTCKLIKGLPEAPHVLVHAAYNFAEDLSSCLLAGTDSYPHKRTGLGELLEAVHRTASGQKVWNVGEHIGESRSVIHTTSDGTRLTSREREVLALKLQRYSNIEIAKMLHVRRINIR